MTLPPTPLALVFGECLVDWIEGEAIPGGAPFNVARHLAAFGLPVQFMTRLGRDDLGELLLAELRRFGVGTELVQMDHAHTTGQVMVHKAPGEGHRFEILPDQAYDHIAFDLDRVARVAAGHPGRPWLVFGTLAQRSPASRETLRRLREQFPFGEFADINWREGHVAQNVATQALQSADIVKLSAEELAMMLRWRGLDCVLADVPPAAGESRAEIAALLTGSRLTRLIVTYGADGYAQFDRRGNCQYRGGAQPIGNPSDTVGAGDAFSSIALMGALLGWPQETALARANDFAAAICQIRGAAPADLSFYQGWADRWSMPSGSPGIPSH